MKTYAQRITEIGTMLETRTVSELEEELGINAYDYDYTGIGFGYQIKPDNPKNRQEALEDMKTPLFDELVALSERL
jgi:hypothetical protein